MYCCLCCKTMLMLRKCEGDGNASLWNGWGVVVVSAWHVVVHVVQVLCLSHLMCYE